MATIEIRDILDNETGKTIFPRTHVDAVIGLKDFSFFEEKPYPGDPTKKYVWLKDEYVGLGALGWIANGGIGSGSVGGGGASFLNDLLDVDASSPSNGESLIYDSSRSKWVPGLVNTGGVSLSLSTSATYLTDSNGRYLKDSTGRYLVTSGTTSSINLLDASGTVLSSVSIPSVDASSYLTGFVPASRRINGHALSADVTLNASDIGLGNVENTALSSWSGSSEITTLGTISSGSIPLSIITGADDLKAIESITGTHGFLKKTATNVWELDTTQYLPLTGGALTGDLALAQTSHIDIGPLRIEYDATNEALHITKADSSDTTEYGIYADGFSAAGGVGTQSGSVKYVNCATQSEYNAIANKSASTIYTIGNPVTKIYIGTIPLYSES